MIYRDEAAAAAIAKLIERRSRFSTRSLRMRFWFFPGYTFWMGRASDNSEKQPLRIRVLATISVVIGIGLMANIVLVMKGFASCTESESFLAGLMLMAFYVYGVPASVIGGVLGVIAWLTGRARPGGWQYVAWLGVALNAIMLFFAVSIFFRGGALPGLFKVFGIEGSCHG